MGIRDLGVLVLRRAALAAFALSTLIALPPAFSRSARWAGQAAALAGEDLAASRRRALGDGWVAAIDAIRDHIPPDGSYAVVGVGAAHEGNAYWVRFDLAPRHPHDLGLWSALPASATLPAQDRWVVLAFHPPQPPALLSREQFLDLLRRRHGGR